MHTELELAVIYSTIGVFTDKPDNGLNNWTDMHVRQGFSWRSHSVSFRTGRDCGLIHILVEVAAELRVREEAARVIQVPFEVDFPTTVISDCCNFEEVAIPLGSYALVFQHWWGEEDLDTDQPTQWAVLSFITASKAPVMTIKADDEIEIPESYSMVAEQA